ncbi:MAG: hypothetical protein J6B37_02585 [Clostridia bacterium]|nr:hypothetical protein [Clostridia bacterium]
MEKKISLIQNICFIVAMVTLIPIIIFEHVSDYTVLSGPAEIVYRIILVISIITLLLHWIFNTIVIIKAIVDKVKAKKQVKKD